MDRSEGVRARHEGRAWLVRTEDLVDEPRFPSDLRGRILGFEAATAKPRRRRQTRELLLATRPVYVRFSDDEYALLATHRDRYGSFREALGHAVRVLASDDPREEILASLRRRLEETRGELAAAREQVKKAKAEAARVPVGVENRD